MSPYVSDVSCVSVYVSVYMYGASVVSDMSVNVFCACVLICV